MENMLEEKEFLPVYLEITGKIISFFSFNLI